MKTTTIADVLAQADAKEQAQFLNRFVQVLDELCRKSEWGGISMQRLYIAEELSPKASEFFSELHGTYSYLQDERVQNQAKCDRLREEIRSLEAQREALAQSLTAAAEAQP